MSLFVELKRRNVFRVAAAYLVFGWLVLQIADVVFPALSLPDWAITLVTVLLAIGLLPALIFSWVFELTPEGVKKESEIDRSQSITTHTGKKLDYITLIALIGVVIFVLVERDLRAPTNTVTLDAPQAEPQPVATGSVADQASGPEVLSIAVLPFVNMSADAENEYFADGVAEEILNLISKAEGLRVISRSSAFSFKGQNLPIPEVARVLNVNHVLEGSVRRSGDRVRVTAQLIQVHTDAHLWSETFDRTLDDIFAVQDEIAGSIADALQVTLGVGSAPKLDSLDAYELVLKGRGRVGRRTIVGINESIDLFTRASELAPDYAEAYGQLSMSYLLKFSWETQAVADRDAIRDMALKALALDETNVAALTGLASYHFYILNLDEADRWYRKALSINPNSVQANNWYGDYLTVVLRTEEAVHFEQKAAELDPMLAVHKENVGLALWMDGRIDEAALLFQQAFELDPKYPSEGLLMMLAKEGRRDLLEKEIQRREIGPRNTELLRWIVQGKSEEVIASLALQPEVSFNAPGANSLGILGALLCMVGAFDQAVDALEAIDPVDVDSYMFPNRYPTDPEILRAYPRYADWWRQPPRDRLLKARGHWIWDEGNE
jgi:TolB-like protein/Tfp pilus assembly protein PilF